MSQVVNNVVENKRHFWSPRVDYHDVQHSWFSYAGKPYQVATASPFVFKAAILQKAPTWKQHCDYGPILHKRDLDLFDRWYLLDELARTHNGIVLRATSMIGG
jgi:hypothetical protein